jgi:endonuclease YncB( thermonuclease family)
MATLAFLLLIAALVLFIVSTRQWALWMRGAVWGGGLLLLIAAWMTLGNAARDPELGAAFADFFGHLGNPGDSMVSRMLESNGASVARIVLSLFDIFIIFGLLVAVLALVAFTPGEGMEMVLRPVMAGTIGAIVGGLIALAIVGTGFGQREERQAYAGPALSETVYDGDTLLLNGDLVRLRGIDAPQASQICRLNSRTQDCGQEATLAMRRIIEGAFVMCALDNTPEPQSAPPAANADSQAAGAQGDGRGRRGRSVTCTAVRNGQEFNVARRMVEEGYAVARGDTYQREAADAAQRTRGLTAWCTLRPDVWARRTTAEKNAFRDRGTYVREWATFGTCPPPTARWWRVDLNHLPWGYESHALTR